MRVAAVYDVHGNLPALEAVLRDIRDAGVDRIVVGGDVLPGPMPRESLACLQDSDIPVQYIGGNGDRVVLEQMRGVEPATLPAQARDVVRWTAAQLDAGHEQTLASWPPTIRLEIDQVGGVLFCHATPRNDSEIFTRLTSEDRLRPVFETVDAPLVVCGHTHMQFDRTIGRVRVVNAGSVGMPYGEPGAYWLLLGPGVELRRTAYDLAAAAERIRRTAYPQAIDFVERDLLQPRSEHEMLELFGRAEIR
jgi:predicted phosphodiesterase